MNKRIRLLTLTVNITSSLLIAAGALIVVGIFNAALSWDIFGPKLEAVLYSVFGSCIALAAVGVGLTLVLGTQEIVRAFQRVQQSLAREEAAPEPPKSAYARVALYVVLALAVLVTALAGLNHAIQIHRSGVFKKLAREQMEHFNDKLVALMEPLREPPRDNVPFGIHDLVRTLDGLTFVRKTTLYMPDPSDESAMWGYTAWREYRVEDGFARFFIARDFERAMKQSLEGAGAALDEQNAEVGFTWYHVIRNAASKPVAVLRIDGNPRENFREYFLGS